MNIRIWAACVARFIPLSLLPFTVGCGDGRPSRVPIAGQVLIDGKPLSYGFVEFIPDNARPSSGKLDEQGRFRLSCFEANDGAVAGINHVAVTAREPIGGNKVRWHAPKKYADRKTSNITQDLNKPTDSLVLNLSWDGGKPFVEIAEGTGANSGEVERFGPLGTRPKLVANPANEN
jgi:hypothetical protein